MAKVINYNMSTLNVRLCKAYTRLFVHTTHLMKQLQFWLADQLSIHMNEAGSKQKTKGGGAWSFFEVIRLIIT